MENFDWTKFTRKIAVKASMEMMYNAWSKSEEIEKWFLEKTKYTRGGESKVDRGDNIEKGDEYAWSWYLYDPLEYGKITAANEKDYLQFTFAGDCLVDIKLSTQEKYTIVELTQKNIPTDDKSKRDIRLGCDGGWSFYLVNLKSVYEGGIDLRNKDKSLNRMVNM